MMGRLWAWGRRRSPSGVPIVVGGFYRSGTTLLRRLLDAHAAVHCPPELKFFRDVLGEYEDDAYGHLRFFNASRALPLSESERVAIAGRMYVALREAALARLGKQRWADKEPENARYLPLWEQVLGERFVYVHILRDPLDMFASLREMRFDKSIAPALPVQVARFRDNAAAALDFFERAPARAYCLRYETLARAPAATLGALLDWLGLDHDEAMLQMFNAPARGRGLEDPKINATTGIHEASVGRGVRELDAGEQALIDGEVGELVRALGAYCTCSGAPAGMAAAGGGAAR